MNDSNKSPSRTSPFQRATALALVAAAVVQMVAVAFVRPGKKK